MNERLGGARSMAINGFTDVQVSLGLDFAETEAKERLPAKTGFSTFWLVVS